MRLFSLIAAASVALCLGACNPADTAAVSGAGLTPTVAEGALTPESIAASGLPQATQDKLTKGLAKIEQVRAAAARLCGFVPIAASVANVFIAASATTQTVQGIANLTCKALGSAPAYASLRDRSGERVTGHLQLNGWDVQVIGYRQ